MPTEVQASLHPSAQPAKSTIDGVDTIEAVERTLHAVERYASSLGDIDGKEARSDRNAVPVRNREASEFESRQVPEKPSVAETETLPGWSELFQMCRGKCRSALRARRAKAKTLLACALTLFLVGLVPWPYTVKCNVVCEPAIRRYVAAPFDARLLKSHVVVGQTVAQGELLATLDGGELYNELAAVRAKLAQSKQRHSAALSQGDHSKSEFERLEMEHLLHELEILEKRQLKLSIRSPIDGVVVSGDLERAEGATVSLGDNLFEIASLNRLIAEIAIPESRVTSIGTSQSVRIWLDAAPGWSRQSNIKRIHQRSELRENASVYIAQAELSNDEHTLRPGMNGTAAIEAGYKPIAWLLFHRPYDAIRKRIGW
ncbi:MAG: efflux RND transporter periplasmic adaptor subunit [Pirellulaceae bacterium]